MQVAPVQGVFDDAVAVEHLQHGGREACLKLVVADCIREEPFQGVEIDFNARVAPIHGTRSQLIDAMRPCA